VSAVATCCICGRRLLAGDLAETPEGTRHVSCLRRRDGAEVWTASLVPLWPDATTYPDPDAAESVVLLSAEHSRGDLRRAIRAHKRVNAEAVAAEDWAGCGDRLSRFGFMMPVGPPSDGGGDSSPGLTFTWSLERPQRCEPRTFTFPVDSEAAAILVSAIYLGAPILLDGRPPSERSGACFSGSGVFVLEGPSSTFRDEIAELVLGAGICFAMFGERPVMLETLNAVVMGAPKAAR
jgi:hypothetical protein